jgi:AcrR family transcriptional regulator
MNTYSPNAPSRRQKERDSRRQAILSAAEEVFSELGYHAASLAEIARRADFAVGTIYRYFSDKSDLYGKVILAKMEQVVALFADALETAETAPAGLRAAIHAQFGFHDANRSCF